MNDSLSHPGDGDRLPSSSKSAEESRVIMDGIWKLGPGEEAPKPEITPLPDGRFLFRCSLDQETYDLIEDVRELLADEIPSGDLGTLMERALQAAIEKLEGRESIP